MGQVVFLYIILITQLVTPQGVISPTSGIRAHGVVCGKDNKIIEILFAVGARTILHTRQAHKTHTNDLGKMPNKRVLLIMLNKHYSTRLLWTWMCRVPMN